MQEICLSVLNNSILNGRDDPVIDDEACPITDTRCRASEHFFPSYRNCFLTYCVEINGGTFIAKNML